MDVNRIGANQCKTYSLSYNLGKIHLSKFKGLYWIALATLLPLAAQNKTAVFYLGFGGRLNFGFHNGIESIAGKFCSGVFTEEGFINISVAAQQPFFRKTRDPEEKFSYIEMQRGLMIGESRMTYRGGVGFSFFNTRREFMFLPRAGGFVGRVGFLSMLFFTTEVLLTPSEKLSASPGFEFNMPIFGMAF